MLIMTDITGITVKNTVDDENHVRIGITLITFWVDGAKRRQLKMIKPSFKFTINELSGLLVELLKLSQLKQRG